MAASDTYGVGDTVNISGKVTYSSPYTNTVTLETTSGEELDLEAKDVTLVKKAIPPKPSNGSILKAVSKYGTVSRYHVDSNGRLVLLDSDGRRYDNYITWEGLNSPGSTVTVI